MAKAQPIPTTRQAIALLDSGRFREAERACRRILKSHRRNFDALHVLGVVLGQQNLFDEAIACFNKALRVRPGAPIIHCGLGKLNAMRGLYDEALAHYDRALKLDAEFPLALAGKAETLTRRGDYDAARACLEPVIEAGRADAEVASIYAETLQNAGRHEDAVELIERFLADRRVGPEPRRKLLFALGTSYTKLKNPDRAFDAYRRANEQSLQPFDIVARRRVFDTIIERFRPERIAARPHATNDSELPVFIVGMPRSGSTLTEQIIAAHPQAYGAGEISDFTKLVRGLPAELKLKTHYPKVADDLSREQLDRFASRHLGRLRQHDREALRIVDKHLDNSMFLGLIAMMFPRARVIHCKRDPMSICFSIYTLPLSPISQPYSTNLRNLGLYYREYERLMEHWLDVLDLPILEIQYEELVADQDTWSRRIIDFCGLEWDDACLRFHETGRDVATASFDQVRKPMYTSALRRYEMFDAHLGPLKEALGIDGAS